MRQHYTRLIATSVAIALVAITGALAQTITGADWGGADLDPADGAILSGTFTNVGTFRVQAGRTVYIEPGTVLSISAASADIAGTINGVGAGYSGGTVSGAGMQGGSGAGPGGGEGGQHGGCVHGSGGAGGGYGASGGNGASHFGSGPVPSIGGPAYGTASGTDIAIGSGGGAGASHCGGSIFGLPGAGGNGGAAIEIITTGALDISGTIVVDGAPGEPGQDNQYAGAAGGGGAGGGIRLVGAGGTITGTLSAEGGDGGRSGNSTSGPYAQPGGGGAGGRIKVDANICTSLATLSSCGGLAGALGDGNTSEIPSAPGGTGSFVGGTGCDGDPAGTTIVCPTASEASLTLTAPAAGDCITAGETTTIAWTSTGVSNVRIDTSSDGGATYGTLATVDASTGSYSWEVPTTQTPSSMTRIMMVDADAGTTLAESGDFTVSAPIDSDLEADREYLWSMSPDMTPINVIGSINGGCATGIVLSQITATEDGMPVDVSADVQDADYGTDDRSFSLRSTTNPGVRGRLYRIEYTATTASGYSTTETVFVPVLPAATRAFHGPETTTERVTLEEPTPNPMTMSTDISYTLSMTCATRLWVESLSGDRVIILQPDQLMPAGTHTFTWNGLDAAGDPVPNGAYLVQLKACGEKQVVVVVVDRILL